MYVSLILIKYEFILRYISRIDCDLIGSIIQVREEIRVITIKGVLQIPQSFQGRSLTMRCSSMSYPGHLLQGTYSSAEMKSKFSSAPADWAKYHWYI